MQRISVIEKLKQQYRDCVDKALEISEETRQRLIEKEHHGQSSPQDLQDTSRRGSTKVRH
jgi:hypothetical protein